jgi:hypothetical protein
MPVKQAEINSGHKCRETQLLQQCFRDIPQCMRGAPSPAFRLGR